MVVVSEIKYIFIHQKVLMKTANSRTVWLYASSGVYLLELNRCSPEYLNEMYALLNNKFMRDD